MVVNEQSEMVERDGEPIIFTFFPELYIRGLFFSPLYTTQAQHLLLLASEKKREKMKEEKKSAYWYYIMFSKQQIPSASYLWVCSPSSGTCCIF